MLAANLIIIIIILKSSEGNDTLILHHSANGLIFVSVMINRLSKPNISETKGETDI